jgi:hypothetical protein
MVDATGEAKTPPLRVTFDRRLKLEFHGAKITSDGGLLAYRELDDALDLTMMGVSALAEGRRGRNIRHQLLGLLRQAIYGRLAGYEDVNDADRLARDPAMRAIVGREGLDRAAASRSQMGRFEIEWLASDANLAALTDLSGAWIDRVHARRPPDGIILDLDSSESPTYGDQQGSAWNGHFRCTCYHPLFLVRLARTGGEPRRRCSRSRPADMPPVARGPALGAGRGAGRAAEQDGQRGRGGRIAARREDGLGGVAAAAGDGIGH